MTTKLEFTEAVELPNKQNPEKAPWLALGYQAGKRVDRFTFGQKKAKAFLDNLDAMNEAFNIHNPETDGFFEYAISLNAGTEFAQQMIITEPKLQLINHYKKDIAAYLDRHPIATFSRKAIQAPFVSKEVIGLDYVQVLHLPCFQPREGDEGEGLIEKRVTQKSAKFIMERAFKDSQHGSSFNAFKFAITNNVPELVDHYKTNGGEVKDIKYSLDEMKCYVRYKAILMEFAMSGTFTEE